MKRFHRVLHEREQGGYIFTQEIKYFFVIIKHCNDLKFGAPDSALGPSVGGRGP